MGAVDELVAVNVGVATQFLGPLVGQLQHIRLVAKPQGTRRTGFDTARLQGRLDAGQTEVAFVDLVRGLIVAGNVEGTGRHTLLTTDAPLMIDTDGSIFGVIKRSAGTGLDAGRIGTMHAAIFPEEPLHAVFISDFLEPDQGPGIGLKVGRVLIGAIILRLLCRLLVPLLAGKLTTPASRTF